MSYMENTQDSFEHLVAGLTSEERTFLFQKIKGSIENDKESLVFDQSADNFAIKDLEKELKNESLFLRIWIFLKKLFSSSDTESVYNEYRVAAEAKRFDSEHPNLIHPTRFTLENLFYEYLLKLRSAAAFFKSGINEYEKNEDDFYIFLNTLVMPDLKDRVEREVNPFSLPADTQPAPDVRAALIHKLNDILESVDPEEKSKLHGCLCSLDWLRQFVHLPFARFTACFSSSGAGNTMSCGMDIAKDEIERFASVLCYGKRIFPEVLETLYMFASQAKMNAGEKVDVENGLSVFLQKSVEHVGFIKYFIHNVPLRSLGIISHRAALWTPMYKEFSGNWFARCQSQWRRIFDQKWELWVHERKLIKTKERITTLFKTKDYPLIPNRPWQKLQDTVVCMREYSLSFLYAFFVDIYPSLLPFLKVILVDGKFALRENGLEFTDTYNSINHLCENVISLNAKFSSTGVYGQAFANIELADMHTIQGQEKANALVRSIEAEANLLISVFGDCCRSFRMLFDGILGNTKNMKYGALSNLSALTSPDKKSMRQHFDETITSIEECFELLKEVESLESTSPLSK